MSSEGRETLLAISTVDAHFALDVPANWPCRDKFSKALRLALIHDALMRRARIELTSLSSMADDALTGDLDLVTLTHQERQPNLVTIVINQDSPANDNAWTVTAGAQSDYRRQYRLLNVDVYFWTAADATAFLAAYKEILKFDAKAPESDQPVQATGYSHVNDAQSLVQKLEQVAVADARRPAVNHGPSSLGPERGGSACSSNRSASLQPPPGIAAYNPAAPVAPERIAHREKTPPPVEAGPGGVPAQNIAMAPPANPYLAPTHYPMPPTTPSALSYGQAAMPSSNPWTPGAHAANPHYPPTQYASVPCANPQSPFTPGVPPPQYGSHRREYYDTPIQSPSYVSPAPIVSPTFAPPPTDHVSSRMTSPEVPSQANDSHALSHHSAIHQQYYQPAQNELAHGIHGHYHSLTKAQGHNPAGKTPKGKEESPTRKSKLEAGAARLDKGVNRFFKKLERI